MSDGKVLDMFAGALAGIIGLPVNERATALFHAYLRMRGETRKRLLAIHGPVVIFDKKVWHPDLDLSARAA